MWSITIYWVVSLLDVGARATKNKNNSKYRLLDILSTWENKNILSCVYCSFVHNKGGGGGIRFYEYLRLRKLYKM